MSLPPNRKKLPAWLVVLIWVSALVLLVALLVAVDSLTSGELVSKVATQVIALLLFWGVILGAAVVSGRFKGVFLPIREPLGSHVREALDSAGFPKSEVRYSEKGSIAIYPRPMLYGANVTLPKRVCDEYSESALLWSVKTDVASSKSFNAIGMSAMLGFIFLALISVGLGQRFHQNWLAAVAVGWVVLGFAGAFFGSYRAQLIADRRFTLTDADLAAAKEALSYPYFAQQDQSWSKKWLFSRAELKGRARQLGIELERGYRVDAAAAPISHID